MLTLLAVAACLVVLGFAIANAAPPSTAERAAAQAQVDRQLSDPMFVDQLEQCRAAVAAGGSDAWPADMDCDENMLPRVEWYLGWSPPEFIDTFESTLLGVTMLLAAALVVAGVTFAGADWSSGTIGTQLLFQPRRWRVFGNKVVALAAWSALVAAVVAALAWLVSYWMAAKWGSTALLDYDDDGTPIAVTTADLIGDAVRAVLLVVGAATGGFGLAMLFRSSLAAVGLLAGYSLVGEAILRGLFPGVEPYLLSTRVLAWLQGPYRIYAYPSSCGMDGAPCEPVVTTIGVTGGGVFLLALLAVVVTAAAVLFQRRDVT